MTYSLKYRPQKISELDLVKVRETLTRILASRDIPHAFLFSGLRGAGKTSAARIVAKVINCEKLKVKGKRLDETEPCNECSQCLAITNGSSLDVIEIDAASNRGVDDIRSLREGVKLAPASARKKVYIIDEAHMLTNEASNALLKTLEEPPEHVVFVLATTNSGKLLDTIRSRCTNVVFPKATKGEIVGSLEKAVKGEKLKVEKGVLEQIAKGVDGSFREAHKILEQVSIGREKVRLGDLEQVHATNIEKLLEYLKNKDVSRALKEVDIQVSSGADPKQYAVSVVSAFRMVLLSEYISNLQGETLQKYAAQDFGGVEKVREAIELFSKAVLEIPNSPIAQLPIELAIVEFVSGRPESLRSSNNSPSAEDGTDSRDSARSGPRLHPLESGSDKFEHRSATSARPVSYEKKEKEKEGPKVDSLPQEEVRGEELLEKWKVVMQIVKPKNHSIEALLRATRPKSFDGQVLTLEVFYNFHKERIEKDPCRSLVEEIAKEILGAPVKLTCLLSPQKQRAVDFVNVTETVEDDIVRVAEDIFGVQASDSGELPN